MLDTALRTERPASIEDVVALVAEAGAGGRRIEVLGGGTKRGVGRTADCDLLLSTEAMSAVVDYAPDELVLTVQAGAKLADLEALVAKEGQMLAFEPPHLTRLLGSKGSPTIGGVLGANLSGPRRIRSGAARDHFLGFEGVNGRGERFKAGGKVVKNVTGYDLPKLMAGSWGTLAVLTEVTLKVLPAGRTEVTLMVFGLDDRRAMGALNQAMNSSAEISGAAHLPAFAASCPPLGAEMPVTLLRIEGFKASVQARAEAVTALLKPFGRVEQLDALHSRGFWAMVREVDVFAADPRPLWRLSVPGAQAWKLEALGGARLYDWAGGLVWFLADSTTSPAEVRARVKAIGGHATLYRGDGAPAFEPLEGGLKALSQRVKAAFDPLGVLNPGRLLEGA